jgi:hypothetical protein
MAGATGDGRVKVLFIAGLPHTGSTILANILGEVEGFFAAGELVYLGESLELNGLCSCGKPTAECEIWSNVVRRAFRDERDAIERMRPERSWLVARQLPSLMLQERHENERLNRYRQALGDVCRATAEVTDARVVIETTKRPSFGRLLASAPGLDVRVVHLIRDPRALVHSWARVGQWGAGPLEIGATFSVWHELTRRWHGGNGHYLPVRYEDFMHRPRDVIQQIVEHMDEAPRELPFEDDRTVRLQPNHVCSGNQNRFRHGLIELRSDDEWKTRVSRPAALAVMTTSWPLRRKWGYRLRERDASRAA